MPVQTLPSSATDYARARRRETGAALAAIRRQWRRIGGDFDAGWRMIEGPMLGISTTAQARVAAQAQAYIPAVLEDTGQTESLDVAARPRTTSLVGVAGDGRPVDTLLYGAVTTSKTAVADGASTFQALRQGERWLTLAAGTLLSDTARQSESLGMGVRTVTGYVRMLTPPSCSRCAILAGRWYRKNQGFDRHPGCDCTHIPSSESVAGDLTVDTGAYFESLDTAEQDRVFTKAGAEAIRNGADVNQVVNARRGMATSQAGRLKRNAEGLYASTEGTTSRGRAFQALKGGGTQQELAGTAMRRTRNGPEMRVVTRTRARAPRLMPESIAELAAGDRDRYLALLRANGYLL